MFLLWAYLNGSFLQAGIVQAGWHNFRHFAYISRGHATIGYSDRTDYWVASLARRKVNNIFEYHIYGFTSFLYRVTPLVLDAFIVRLFREKNKDGFVKAFTEQPEHITSGLSPLKNIMKELQLRNVHIYPRYVCFSSLSLALWRISYA